MVINIKWSELKLIENKPDKFIKVVIKMLPYWMEKKIEECSLSWNWIKSSIDWFIGRVRCNYKHHLIETIQQLIQ